MAENRQEPIPELKFGFAEEFFVRRGHELSGHLEDGIGGSRTNARGEFLGLRFEFGYQRLGHGGLLPKGNFLSAVKTTPK